MPSTIIGQPLASGPQQLISGNPWSGDFRPIGGIQLVVDRSSSGSVYVGFSGNMTFNSGGMFLSGATTTDGMQINPGGSYFVPKVILISGSYNVYLWHDAACSGQCRVYYERGF
jgi:hypothetical protein